MIATRQAVAITFGRMSASSAVARSVCAFIARSCSGVTCCIRTRELWNVKLCSGRARSRSRSKRGTSVSIVVFELGTIRPTRCDDFIFEASHSPPLATRGSVGWPPAPLRVSATRAKQHWGLPSVPVVVLCGHATDRAVAPAFLLTRSACTNLTSHSPGTRFNSIGRAEGAQVPDTEEMPTVSVDPPDAGNSCLAGLVPSGADPVMVLLDDVAISPL